MKMDYQQILSAYDDVIVDKYEAGEIDSPTYIRLMCKLAEWRDNYYGSEVSE